MKILLITSYIAFAFTAISSAQTASQNPANDQRQIGGSAPSTSKNNASTNEPAIKSKSIVKPGTATDKELRATNGSSIPLVSALDRSKEYTNALKQVLNMTDDQTRKMTEVNTVFIQQIDKLSKVSKNNTEFQLGLTDADRTRVEGYNKLLTARQFKVYTDTPQLSGLTSSAVVRTDMVKPDAGTDSGNKNTPPVTQAK